MGDPFDMSKIVKEYIRQIKETDEYQNSTEFEFDLVELRNRLENHGTFATSGVWYNKDEFVELDRKAIKIADALYQTKHDKWKRVDGSFPEVELTYDGIIFSIMQGQGTLYTFRLEGTEL
jgi:hypothetical protein